MKKFTVTIILVSFFLHACKSIEKEIDKTRRAKAKEKITAVFAQYDSSDWTKRKLAVKKIRSYTGKDELPFAEKSLLKASYDDHCEIRIEALKGLVIIATQKAKSRIVELTEDSKCNNARWYALKCLAVYKNRKYGDIFKKAYKSNDWILREAAIIGFLNIQDKKYLNKHITVILNMLKDPAEANRLTALKHLHIKDEKLYKAITAQYDNIPIYRISIIKSYLNALNGYILDPKTREKIIEYLIHENKDIRISAYRVLLTEHTLKKQKAGS